MKQFVTADLHICHEAVFKRRKHLFASIEEMHETIILNWNSVVGILDEVYILGDAWDGEITQEIVDVLLCLNGKLFLVQGNHDKIPEGSMRGMFNTVFTGVMHYHRLEGYRRPVILSHYPLACWDGSFRGSMMLHGHTHASYQGQGRIRDVGMEATDFMPQEVGALVKELSKIPVHTAEDFTKLFKTVPLMNEEIRKLSVKEASLDPKVGTAIFDTSEELLSRIEAEIGFGGAVRDVVREYLKEVLDPEVLAGFPAISD